MRVIIIHSLDHALAALEAAGDSGVVLQSAPNAIFYAGSLYLLEVFNAAKKHFPQARATFILDCGDAGAEAVEALRIGHKTIRSNAPAEMQKKLADIARRLGAEIISGEYEGLDLRGVRDTKDACRKWLEQAQ